MRQAVEKRRGRADFQQAGRTQPVHSLIKDTSLVSVIAVSELMLATKEVIATTFQPFPLYLAAAAIYWGDERVVRDTAKKAGDAPEPELFALRTVIDTPDCRGM